MNLYTREKKRKKEMIQLVRGERRKERILKEVVAKKDVISHNRYEL
jgi:hypothetical protein